MDHALVLASASSIRAQMLRAAGVAFEIRPARIDEAALRAGLAAEGMRPREIAAELAHAKARKVSGLHPADVVIGSDQLLEVDGVLLSKAGTVEELCAQLDRLAGRRHHLHAAAVICEDGREVWRHVESVALTMRRPSPAWIESYVRRNWSELRHCVGGYMLEGEGIRMFARIDGDWFSALGMPLLPLLNHLADRSYLPT